ncbi:hypothetical protein IW261DRAFT_177968 [Armillaria novae-zelandiae]|uniref:Heterokaryon incompatibility domain-containing protein n=1 Tax=Armillaria novae-zelandiae TaxID=153914 RepID=A0AA39NBR4_9AGAR|nr:hypothetical protein IW261DRAFT_177968 [Armillaria novae-zelandiae]
MVHSDSSVTIKLTVINEKPNCILDGRGDEAVDIKSSATPQRYRLVDCIVLTEDKTLRIYEFTNFLVVAYCAVSYVWCNIPSSDSFVEDIKFDVKGTEEADPINTDELHHACMASLRGCTYLWLDRLYIMQTSKDDKRWKIKEIYRMYQSCDV